MFTIPVLDVKTNALDALLAGVGYRLSMLAGSGDDEFSDLIADRDVTIQIGSEADGVARYFEFNNGKFSQHSGKADEPDLSIDFQDSMTGVKLLTGGNVASLMTAIQDKEMSMEGDYSLLMWFNQLAKHIVPTIPEEYKPYIQQAKPYAYKAGELGRKAFGFVKHKLGR